MYARICKFEAVDKWMLLWSILLFFDLLHQNVDRYGEIEEVVAECKFNVKSSR